MNTLKIEERKLGKGHSGRKIRAKGRIPGVIYGKEARNMLFEVGSIELGREISECGEFGVLNIDLNGENKQAIIKELQREPVNHKIIHIDLEEVESGEKIQTEIPIQFEGEDYLLKGGSVLQKEKAYVKVECDANNMPKGVILDVSKAMGGSVFKVADIEMANELSIVDDLDAIVASVSYEIKVEEPVEENEVKE